jgi:hypothetical protein
MSEVDEILDSLPIAQIAAELGEDPQAVEQAAAVALPALLGGMQANAQDPAGEASLAAAVGQHDETLASGPVDLASVDVDDGEKITRHVFGDQQDAVIRQLGGASSAGLVKKLLPILAPIVLSYLAKRMGAKGGATAGGGILGSILSQILAGAAQGGGRAGAPSAGSILGDLLGGLLGGGRR